MTNLDEVAEDLMVYVPLNPGGARETLPDAVLTDQPGSYSLFSSVGRVRTSDVAGLVARARAFFHGRGRSEFVWFLGPSSRPQDLEGRLLALGAERADVATAMLMTEAPPDGPAHDIRPVTDLETMRDFERMMDVDDPSRDESSPSQAEQMWARMQGSPGRSAYVAYLDGRPVSGGGLIVTDQGFCILSGGATVPEARGRGLYRALVAHRWRVAAAAGVPVLAVQASEMSQPILARAGFRSVAPLTILSMGTLANQ